MHSVDTGDLDVEYFAAGLAVAKGVEQQSISHQSPAAGDHGASAVLDHERLAGLVLGELPDVPVDLRAG
ncbi:MAG TPA: hypothetical protein VFQ15_10715, partial [Jiangellaceae bacterium]|nr:hypothetical protein [Jiangellaceae bacterium]